MNRSANLLAFYEVLSQLAHRLRGPHRFKSCSSRMRWPERGIYFIFEDDEVRRDTGAGPRCVRVGTHAIKAGARTTLWHRLSQHRGSAGTGNGNHRGSIFRLQIGDAIIRRDGLSIETWGNGPDPKSAARRFGLTPEAIRDLEQPIEKAVSNHIGNMQVLWVNVDDPPGPSSRRSYLEQNSIALLSNYRKAILDPASSSWLGSHSSRSQVHESGLWNIREVERSYDPAFIQALEAAVQRTLEP